MFLRIQTTPVERKSHARIVHDQVTADSLSLVVDVPEGVQRQSLTPPPMSSKLVSKFAIPSANSKHLDQRRFHQSNRLVLCEIRLMAISSIQDAGVSICLEGISSPNTNLQTRYVSGRNIWSGGGHLASTLRTGLITLPNSVLPRSVPCVKFCGILGEMIRSLVKRGQIQALFRTLIFGISLKVDNVVFNSLCVDNEIKRQQLCVRDLEYEQCPELSHCLVIDKARIADRIHPLKVIVATMIFKFSESVVIL